MKKILFCLLLILPAQLFAQVLQVTGLQCEYATNPASVEALSPKLNWKLRSDDRNVLQTAYRILVADNEADLAKNTGNIWDSKKIASSTSIQVSYKGETLRSTQTYYWKVMVWDNHRHISQWSSVGQWQMGLLKTANWQGAKWIAYAQMPDNMRTVPFAGNRGLKGLPPVNDVLPLIRKTFSINKAVKKATLYICGLGHFDARLNGRKIGDHFLDAGWTQYDKQALYVPFDITNNLQQGENTLGVMLGNGFYFIPRDKRYRKMTGAYGYPKMICRLVIEYADGTAGGLVSDETWKAAPGPITFTSIYGGEDYNANLEQTGWDANNFNDAKWQNAVIVNGPPQLNAQAADPLKVMQEFTPVSKKQLTSTEWVYDLGQNASGIPEITVEGKKGDTVRITPAEVLHADGRADQSGSGKPHYYNYILKGDGPETWQPQFTYYGFRYLQIDGGVPQGQDNPHGLPAIINVKGLHTRNAADSAGDFECSSELFNHIYKLINWAMKSNMASVFTDCPHREKLGWLEEDHLVGNSLHYNFDIHRLALKCINDMRAAQTPEGLIPEIAPEFTEFPEPFRDSPEWGSNAIILPWYVYQWYGDKEVLADNYDMMTKYLTYLKSKANSNILTQGLGDWYDLGPKEPGYSQLTPKGLTATAFYYYDLQIVANIARLLGRNADAQADEKLALQVRESYNKTFFNKQTKQYGTGSQTANAISISMGLVDLDNQQEVIENIVNDLKSHDNALTSGDIGFKFLLRSLEDAARSDIIYAMNTRTDVPGYGYQVTHGATSLTESWGMGGSSQNHFMLGELMEWFYEGLAGIKPAPNSIAFNKITIEPQLAGDITYAKASYNSPYGIISSGWKKAKGKFEITVQIPPNTKATVYLPSKKGTKITDNGKSITAAKYQGAKALIDIGSGIYRFVSSY